MNKKLLFLLPLVLTSSLLLAEDKEPPLFKWRKVEIAKIDIGYGVQLTDCLLYTSDAADE